MDGRRSFAGEDEASGTAYWVTGLPGVGRKTLARALAARLTDIGGSVVHLDGDRMREILGDRFGHGQADRHVLSLAYGRLCREVAGQGHDVVFATVSMFHDVRRWNRASIPNYREIYLRASPALLAQRHPKGLYAAAQAGRIRNVVGFDLPMEEPETADIVIDVDTGTTPQSVLDQTLRRLGLIAPPTGALSSQDGAPAAA
ncbi:adenylyl-sulfate kinase [Phenylobacterium sp.]|uniref:adenylyl-sulfate kinase n=1 Tax=Phenylobacterium sp. TaxID=1871053 RepID=UPI002FC5F7D7